MSKKCLLLTVGGSCQPIVSSIKHNKPEFIVFFCSDDFGNTIGSYQTVIGEGMVCGSYGKPDQPSIVNQLGLNSDAFEVIRIGKFDDFNNCYEIISNHIKIIKNKGFTEIIGDYTGGTKSMSGGLLLAFSEYSDLIISVVKGNRNDLIRVADGSQRVFNTRKNIVLIEAKFKVIEKFGELFEYQTVLKLIDELLVIPDISDEYDEKLIKLRDYYECLNDWDTFNHEKAYLKAKETNCLEKNRFLQLQNVLNSRRCLIERKNIPSSDSFHRYEIVIDLLLNADRKKIQRRFDDAMGRLYRSVELLAQAHLYFNYKIVTSDVEIKLVPLEYREVLLSKHGNGKILLSLVNSYDLLIALNDPIVGKLFKEQRNEILRMLEKRNFSILAHGFKSIDEEDFNYVYDQLVAKFLKPAILAIIGEGRYFSQQLPV